MSKEKRLGAFLLRFAFYIGSFISVFTLFFRIDDLVKGSTFWTCVLIITSIFLFIHIFLKLKEIKNTWKGARAKFKSKLQVYLSVIFFAASFIPSVIVLIFSYVFFQIQMENWLGRPVRKAVSHATNIGKAYLEEHKKIIKLDAFNIRAVLHPKMSQLIHNPKELNDLLNIAVNELGLREIMVFDNYKKMVGKSYLTFSLMLEKIFDKDLMLVQKGEIVTRIFQDRIRLLMLLDEKTQTYILLGKVIDPKVLSYLEQAEGSHNAYQQLLEHHNKIKILFVFYFVLFLILLTSYVTLFSIHLANRLFQPVSSLIEASKKVTSGDWNAQIPNPQTKTEFDDLVYAFNSMITSWLKQHDDLLYHQKKAARADIARKIAHEIKNPLTPIQLSAERLKRKYSKEIQNDPEGFVRATDTIIRQVKTIENLVREFSSFARMPQLTLEKKDIALILRLCVETQKSLYPHIKFILEAQQKDTYFMCDEIQFSQVLLNLIQNAIHSMDDAHISDAVIRITFRENRIEIQDNGPGFSTQALEHVFEPYFTTKKKGTGLGLVISQSIIKDHGWNIVCENNQTIGGCIKIFLYKSSLL